MAKILIVDDDAAARDLLATVLRYSGHQADESPDGADALQRVQPAAPPDLVIADILMPTMDGFEFVRRLREHPEFARTPVVFYTASYLESEVRKLAEACGVHHIIAKPAEPEKIIEVVNRVLGTPQAPAAPLPVEEFEREHVSLLMAKLSQRAAQAVPRLDAMIELNLRLASERDPQQLLANFCAAARKIIGSKFAIVAMIDESTRQLRNRFASGMSATVAERLMAAETSSLVPPERLDSVHPFRLRSPHAGLPSSAPAADVAKFQSLVCAPILSPERVYGWLCLIDKIGGLEFTDEDEALSQVLAAQVGRVYENNTLEREIAERKRAELALRRSEQRYRNLIEEAQDAIFTLAADGGITSLNRAFETVTGWPRDAWLGRKFTELAHEEDRGPTAAFLAEATAGERPASFEMRVRARSGGIRILDLRLTPLLPEGGAAGVLGIGRDITDRKALEDHLRQAQKMESIGRLAGGVAHDFNNLLTVIQVHATMLQTVDLPEDHRDSPREICLAVERGASLTRQLLTFSRRQALQPRDVDLNELVATVTRMLHRVLGENIALRFESSGGQLSMHADPGMIEQIILNLALNGRDAMPTGGQLTLRTGVERLAEDVVRANSDGPAGDYVYLAVEDTGCGIPEEVLPRIFEPFFTTKDEGKGTGLGLATVYGIAKQHHGWVTVESEVTRGAIFTVFLPAGHTPPPKAAASNPPPDQARGQGTILLVEDEPPLRLLTQNILEGRGYRVLPAANGPAALELAAKETAPIDLLLSDVMLPDGLSGHELAERLSATRPGLKVILVSGYSSDALERNLALRGDIRFLQKPFDLETLLRTVRDVLHTRAT